MEAICMDCCGTFCFFVFACVLFCLFYLVWTAVVRRIGPNHRRLWMWASLPVYVLGVTCCITALSLYESLPGVVFKDAIGFAPTPDVQILHSFREMPAHLEDTYLVFYADQSTIDRILQNGFKPMSAKDIVEYFRTPDWWAPNTGHGAKIYAKNTDDPSASPPFDYFAPHELLIYDPMTGKVYFRCRRHESAAQ
jgi:hypothetical protein